jgi:ABC-type lipoprotein export system ATPase subunit
MATCSELRLLEEELIQLLLIFVIPQNRVEFGTRLHLFDDAFLRTVATNGFVHFRRCGAGGSERGKRIQCKRHSCLAQFLQGEQRRVAKLGDVREHRHLDRRSELTIGIERCQCLRENHVGAGRDVSLGSRHRSRDALAGGRIGSRHQDKLRIEFRVRGRKYSVTHLGRRNQFLAGTVTAAFGRNLILEMHGRDSGPRKLTHRAGDVEGVAPAGIDIDEQRKVHPARDSAGVDQHVVEACHPEIREPVRCIRHARAGQIQGLESGALREERRVRVDGAGNLQRTFGRDCGAESRAGSKQGTHVVHVERHRTDWPQKTASVKKKNSGFAPLATFHGVSLRMLAVTELKKSFHSPEGPRVQIVNVPAFNVGTGEQLALRGESGSGKTTFLNLIAGIVAADSGRIMIDGAEVTALSEPKRDRLRAEKLGYIFQTFNLLQGFTVLENVVLGMSFGPRGADRAHAREMLGRVGLGHRLDHFPNQLSTGQQQRVAVARALVNRPKLVLADEPTGNLDRRHAHESLALIRKVCREQDAALLLVSHDEMALAEFESVRDFGSINMLPR